MLAPAVKCPFVAPMVTNEDSELHEPTPTDPLLVNVIEDPAHTDEEPPMLPALGSGLTKILFCTLSDPHVGVVTLYRMITLPATKPLTLPAELTVATDVLVDIQVPPEVPVLVRDIVLPAHTLSVPVITPALGSGFMVMLVVSVVLPQLGVVAVYVIVAFPELDPAVKTPVELLMVARDEAVLQLPVPILVALVRVITDPVQTEEGPAILPALGSGFTKIFF